MAGNVDDHTDLEPDDVLWVECTEYGQEAQQRTAIGNLVQNGPKPSRLVHNSSCVAIERVQQATQQITSASSNIIERHVVEGDESKYDSGIADQVWHEQEYVLARRRHHVHNSWPLSSSDIDLNGRFVKLRLSIGCPKCQLFAEKRAARVLRVLAFVEFLYIIASNWTPWVTWTCTFMRLMLAR